MNPPAEEVTAGPLLDRVLHLFDSAGRAGRAAGLALGLLCIVIATFVVIGGAVTFLRLFGGASQWLFDTFDVVEDHPRLGPVIVAFVIGIIAAGAYFGFRAARAAPPALLNYEGISKTYQGSVPGPLYQRSRQCAACAAATFGSAPRKAACVAPNSSRKAAMSSRSSASYPERKHS